MRRTLATVAAAALVCGGCAGPAADPLVVLTTAGPVRGTAEDGYRTFRGIPFAAPPVGDARWGPPAPVAPWTEPRDATTPAPACTQSPHDPVPGPQSEDCLTLTVTAPDSATPRTPRPVMVWLYGGGFYQGNGGEYGARRLATEGDVVVVTPNYRLGVLGFLRLPGTPDAAARGFQDQQAALRWVQANAGAFGGDPGNVTLFGESAGGMSTCAQLTSPAAAGLFHKAIMQSGTCFTEWPPFGPDGRGLTPFDDAATADRAAAGLAADLGCTDLACLRARPVDEIATRLAGYGPSWGNPVLPEHPGAALRAGRFHRVPVMVGHNRDEARLSITGKVSSPLPEPEYRRLLAEEFGDAADAVLAQYPPAGDSGPVYAQVQTDRTWAHTTRTARDAFAAHVPTYGFEFADRDAPVYPGMPDSGRPYGAFHGAEVTYLFDIDGVDPRFTDDQRRLASAMIGYWSRFAHSSDPNGGGAPQWPPYALDGHVHGLAPGPDGVGRFDAGAEHRLGFWARG